jgi:acyl carrier protein
MAGPLLYTSDFVSVRLALPDRRVGGVHGGLPEVRMPGYQELSSRLKEIIVEALHLEGLDPSRIGDEEPLFGDGLGLDSVDALELVVALEREYGIKIRSDEIDPSAFANVANLARFVAGRRPMAEGAVG